MEAVELSPGQALYIPPFHLHMVKVTGGSMSINLYQSSATKKTAAAFISVAVQGLSTLINDPQPTGTAEYLIRLIARCRGGMATVTSFLQDLVHSRYSTDHAACRDCIEVSSMMPSFPSEFQVRQSATKCEAFSGPLNQGVTHFLDAAADRFAELKQSVEGPDLVLADLVDLLVDKLVGARSASWFLQSCLKARHICAGVDQCLN